jgi:hypothetical protein
MTTLGTKLHFKPGSFYRICDRTGFAVRAEHTQKQWNNIIVRDRSFENRQPQDFVRGRRDDQTVPQPRPRQVNVFFGVQTTLAQTTMESGAFSSGFSDGFDIAAGLIYLILQSVVGFNVGNEISIQLDNGTTFFTTAAAINFSTNAITTAQPLPYPASSGNIVTNMTSFANV